MEMYNVPEHGNADAYLIQGTESNPHLASPTFEQFEAMYNEGPQEFIVEPGLYYPTATNYGYICTGFESPGDWDDHHRIFGLDGQEIQYAGAQTESLPYVYYTPSYGYAQSPFNPYNPYIPGAMVGVDGPFAGTQQYYTVPSYENPMSSPAYFPMPVQPNSTTELFLDAGSFNSNMSDGLGSKHNLSSSSTKPASNQANSLTKVHEGAKVNVGPSKQPAVRASATSGGFSSQASSQVLQARAQVVEHVSNGKALFHRNQLSSNSLSKFGASVHGRAAADKGWPKANYSRVPNDVNGSPDALSEQNRGPRTSKSKHHLAVKAYTTRAGDRDAQGNIIIYTDQYNKDDFPVDYVKAKFFVIKSYSEDDVHKSIKYNVWSSTPNGNKKLDSAYADAQRVASVEPKGCPVFLFFSVNASGMFCGVAEMTGPVDFYKDMDFWQQDKWSGSFPVKWHIIKDVQNPNFRHIILENNENKPVTNSRDTQEIRYMPGMEMLKIFKNHTLSTSLLNDFMYYENRQKIMQEERTRFLLRSPYLVPTLEPPRKLNQIVDLPATEDEKMIKHNNLSSLDTIASVTERILPDPNVSKTSISKDNHNSSEDDGNDNNSYLLKIGSLTINSKPLESAAIASTVVEAKSVDVVTVGSMPIKVNGFAESSGFVTVGTIPLDPRALQLNESLGLTKGGSPLG